MSVNVDGAELELVLGLYVFLRLVCKEGKHRAKEQTVKLQFLRVSIVELGCQRTLQRLGYDKWPVCCVKRGGRRELDTSL